MSTPRVVNRGPATRRAHIRCANPECRAFFRPERPRRRYCCRQCSADCRSRASRVAAGKKGGTVSGARRRGVSLEAIERRVAGMTPIEAFKLGRYYAKTDRFNRATTARREGYSQGFEDGYDAATKDFRLGRTA